MTLFALFTVGLVIALAIALVVWAWCAMGQIEDDLLAFCTFEGTHFEI